jgi:hypothetical protein
MGEIKNATMIAHWPGQDTPACDDHAKKIAAVAIAMGFQLSLTPSTVDELCANCVNEARKK